MKLQRQHFLVNHLKTLRVGPGYAKFVTHYLSYASFSDAQTRQWSAVSDSLTNIQDVRLMHN